MVCQFKDNDGKDNQTKFDKRYEMWWCHTARENISLWSAWIPRKKKHLTFVVSILFEKKIVWKSDIEKNAAKKLCLHSKANKWR